MQCNRTLTEPSHENRTEFRNRRKSRGCLLPLRPNFRLWKSRQLSVIKTLYTSYRLLILVNRFSNRRRVKAIYIPSLSPEKMLDEGCNGCILSLRLSYR